MRIPRTPAATGRGRVPRHRSDAGAGFTQYAAVILLVAGVAVAVLSTGVGDRVGDLIRTGLCQIQTSEDCADTQAAPQGTPEDHGFDKPPPPDGYPSQSDFDDAQDEIEDIREYLDHERGFWDLCLMDCPEEPKDVMDDMTAGELNALVWSLSDDEVRQLLDQEGVREILLGKVNLDTLRRLRGIDPDAIEPDYDDVGEDDSDKKSDDPDKDLGMGEVPNGQLWGDNGEISSDDLSQGGLGDCWWLAGMGAIADQDPQVIKDMISKNPNGTYTVTFGDGEKVTVTPDIVVDEYGSAAFSDPGSDGVMWPAILEKAYAQREGSFGEIEGGWPRDSMETITGNESESEDADDVSQQDLKGWLDSGTAVTITTTGDKEGKLYDDDTLARDHAYVVTSVENGRVSLYNPWGHSHVTMTMEQFQQHIDKVETNSLD